MWRLLLSFEDTLHRHSTPNNVVVGSSTEMHLSWSPVARAYSRHQDQVSASPYSDKIVIDNYSPKLAASRK